ncbi:putative RING-H2 finger protein ATL21A [Andrographis paniculata]|uniref:putative RING-H2 finger protein ATL21A n=1 Tax=Andrographis paniculata TaxID=175694 RepID=UPI0021E94473|nr:putative RING-H2 finger protein ATL21A [Andrographis paniculata]
MEPYSIILLILTILNLSFIHGQKTCPVSFCGGSATPIRYPYKIDGEIPPQDDCAYFNLTCAAQRICATNLPIPAGSFCVQDIDYLNNLIQLYDPGNCLIGKLMMMNFTFDSSPFRPAPQQYFTYAFYACALNAPVLLASRVYPLGCLSNYTHVTIATRNLSSYLLGSSFGCTAIGTWPIPVGTLPRQFVDDEGSVSNDFFLFLTWDLIPVCKHCEGIDGQESGKRGARLMAKIIAIALSLPALIVLALSCCSVFCLHLLRMLENKRRADSSGAIETPQATTAPQLPTAIVAGLDELQIEACTKIISFTETREDDNSIPNAHSNTTSTCSICLDGYSQANRSSARLIDKCGHYFHESCIRQWLGKNGSCPVCRTSLADNAL